MESSGGWGTHSETSVRSRDFGLTAKERSASPSKSQGEAAAIREPTLRVNALRPRSSPSQLLGACLFNTGLQRPRAHGLRLPASSLRGEALNRPGTREVHARRTPIQTRRIHSARSAPDVNQGLWVMLCHCSLMGRNRSTVLGETFITRAVVQGGQGVCGDPQCFPFNSSANLKLL